MPKIKHMEPTQGQAALRPDEVVDILEKMIFTGELQPRERLVVSALSERLGVSSYLVRTALQAMETKGLVKMEPHRGPWSAIWARRKLTRFSRCGWGWRRWPTPWPRNGSPRDLTRLREIDDQLTGCYRRGDLSGVIAANAQFHNYIAGLSGNKTLLKMILELKKRCHIFNTTAWSSPEMVERLFDEHQQYIMALESGDLATLEALPEHHFGHSQQLYLQHLRAKKGSGA